MELDDIMDYITIIFVSELSETSLNLQFTDVYSIYSMTNAQIWACIEKSRKKRVTSNFLIKMNR